MTLIKTSLLNGIAVAVKMLTLMGLNKVLAIYVGPSGFATLGQFQNAAQIMTTLASGAINTGVTKYTAEYHEDESRQHAVWRTAGSISLVASVVVAIGIIAFNKPLANWFFKDESLSSVFIWFAATLVLSVYNTLLLAILNGKKDVHRYVTANIAGSISALIVTTVMASKLGLYGALVAFAIYQSFSFFLTLAITSKAYWIAPHYLLGGIDKQVAKNLAKYTVMALTSAACIPISHILIRSHLGETLGWQAAGYWEAMWRLSTAYLMLVTTTLSVYYLPRLSELHDPADIKKEILQGYKIILPIAVTSGLIIYFFRDFIIHFLFTSDFAGMEELFGWQMVGDTLKIGSWLLAYLMLGKAMVKLFIISEVATAVLFYVLTYYFTGIWGLEGVSKAYAVNYFVYWLMTAVFVLFWLREEKSKSNEYK